MSDAARFTLMVTTVTVGVPLALYFGILGLLIACPSFQAYAVYLHKVSLTWFKDLNAPEQFGFLHNQVVPFLIATEDHKHEEGLLAEELDAPVKDITSTLNFRLLREDPEARLVLYMHGTSGTIGSTIRPTAYRNICSAAPDKIHVLAFDYRGYGLSSGFPSEQGLLLDALAVTRWATFAAGVSPDRIVVYGQSLGSAVSVSLVNYLALQTPLASLAGMVISASFTDLATLTATYRIGGLIPILSPVHRFPLLFRLFSQKLRDKWPVKDKLAEFIRWSDDYHVTLIHSEDDPDIPFVHTQNLFWHAVNASSTTPVSFEELEEEKAKMMVKSGSGGWSFTWKTQKGVIRQEILKYGVHDWQMTYPNTALAILRAFQFKHPEFPA